MNVLVTAGNTQTPLDRVRCITNIFTGRTGGSIAAHAFDRGHRVTVLTSHPEVFRAISESRPRLSPDWQVHTYRTYDDLETLMASSISAGRFDAVIHAAAVSDYRLAGMFAPTPDTPLDVAGKVKSTYPELWLKLVPTAKLVDKIRPVWGFQGVLVKFKLEVGLTEAELLAVAERSRVQSDADLMAANTLEGMHEWALVGNGATGYERIARPNLARILLDRVEALINDPPRPIL